MARECYYCKKAPLRGHNVSHANNKTPKKSWPNLRNVHVMIGKTVRHVRACTRCIRSGIVLKAASSKKTISTKSL